MKNQEIRKTVEELQSLYLTLETTKTAIALKENAIKEEMSSRETEILDLGNVIIRWTSQVADRLATKEVKEYLKEMDVLDRFLKTVYSKRFSIGV